MRNVILEKSCQPPFEMIEKWVHEYKRDQKVETISA